MPIVVTGFVRAGCMKLPVGEGMTAMRIRKVLMMAAVGVVGAACLAVAPLTFARCAAAATSFVAGRLG
ncbi:hypothetical protein [Actinoplanes sp. TFC3]|uniref:hypothetical protein n=1 Tax=Actinoplanes sp. TFC3 TaxID=1710355 RepID=UPI00083107E8|nr:hypothetical protein [Actinoplanes sp. TFC3]